jgi:hypothetical protein
MRAVPALGGDNDLLHLRETFLSCPEGSHGSCGAFTAARRIFVLTPDIYASGVGIRPGAGCSISSTQALYSLRALSIRYESLQV